MFIGAIEYKDGPEPVASDMVNGERGFQNALMFGFPADILSIKHSGLVSKVTEGIIRAVEEELPLATCYVSSAADGAEFQKRAYDPA
jgi:hypothetical protein